MERYCLKQGFEAKPRQDKKDIERVERRNDKEKKQIYAEGAVRE